MGYVSFWENERARISYIWDFNDEFCSLLKSRSGVHADIGKFPCWLVFETISYSVDGCCVFNGEGGGWCALLPKNRTHTNTHKHITYLTKRSYICIYEYMYIWTAQQLQCNVYAYICIYMHIYIYIRRRLIRIWHPTP